MGMLLNLKCYQHASSPDEALVCGLLQLGIHILLKDIKISQFLLVQYFPSKNLKNSKSSDCIHACDIHLFHIPRSRLKFVTVFITRLSIWNWIFNISVAKVIFAGLSLIFG